MKTTANKKNIAAYAIIAAAAALITFGALSGGAREVFMKAALVCYSCIGLG